MKGKDNDVLGPIEMDGPGGVDLIDGVYGWGDVEKATTIGFEYIDIHDLEKFELPSEINSYLWKNIPPLKILDQDQELLSKGIKLPEQWYEDTEYPALVQNVYYLGTILPEIAKIKADFSVGLISEEAVSALLRDINTRINARVFIELNNSDQRLTLTEYRVGEEDPDLLGVSKEKMFEIRDEIWGRFTKEE